MSEAIAAAASPRLEAHFHLGNGRTRMGRCFTGAPLKIAKTFALDEDETGIGVCVCVMDCSPGMLAGDHYQFHWQLESGARVFVTTQGFTRVHPSRENPCLLKQTIRLERGAKLELFPEPLMLFRDASLRTETEVELAEGATLLMGEIVCAGRVGRGEAFEFHALQSRLRVRREGRLIFLNQTGLRPANFDPKRIGAWKGFTHQGHFCVFSLDANASMLDILRPLLETSNRVWSGASRLEEGGVFVSLLGHRACDLQEITQQLREATRDFLPDSKRD